MGSNPSTVGIYHPVKLRRGAIYHKIHGQPMALVILLFALFHLLAMIMVGKAAFQGKLSSASGK
jgi:hypothetical protein